MNRNIMLLIVIAISVTCWASDADDLLRAITGRYGNLASFQARFQQTNTWPDLGKSMESSGTLYYTNERALLRYDEPEGHMLLATPVSIHMWDPGANREIIMAPDALAGRLRPVDIIQSYAQGAQMSVENDGDVNILEVTPATGMDLRKLWVRWNGQDRLIEQLRYEDADGNEVKYAFSQQDFSPTLADSLFILHLPDNRDIIDTRQ